MVNKTTVPLIDRLWQRIIPEPNSGCWLWTGVWDAHGYGRFSLKKPTDAKKWPHQAHRLMYECAIGLIPEGLTLDHLCRTRCCVNPAHLEPVTQKENVARGQWQPVLNAKMTHCKRDHEFTEENTWRNKGGKRRCRACDRVRMAAFHQNRREQARVSLNS